MRRPSRAASAEVAIDWRSSGSISTAAQVFGQPIEIRLAAARGDLLEDHARRSARELKVAESITCEMFCNLLFIMVSCGRYFLWNDRSSGLIS